MHSGLAVWSRVPRLGGKDKDRNMQQSREEAISPGNGKEREFLIVPLKYLKFINLNYRELDS